MKKKYKRHFLDLYRSVRKYFVKPRLYWFFGKWSHEGNLPVWRRGPMIKFGKYGEYTSEWTYGHLDHAEWNELGKLDHPILSKIVKPLYQLPIWLSFYWFNSDLMYKTKWEDDDYRFEFPPHITLVIFGWAISVTAYPPETEHTSADDYWEAMLTYKHYDGDLEKTNMVMGKERRVSPKPEQEWFRFDPMFLKKEEDRKKLKEIQDNYKYE